MSDAAFPQLLSIAEVSIIAKNKVKDQHTIRHFKVTPNTSVNGTLGAYFHVEMDIEDKKGKLKKHQFFMKTMPKDEWRFKFVSSNRLFEKEVNFYKDLSGCFKKILSPNAADVFPECFLAVAGKIVLADATSQGYHPLNDVVQPLDYDHTRIGLMAVARLHAGSIIYEETTGRRVGADFPDVAREANFTAEGLGVQFLRIGSEAIAALAPHLETDLGRDPEAVALLQRQVGHWMNQIGFFLHEDCPHRRVICHGDLWLANFLYRYENEKPISAMLIDFQLMRLCSPAADINMFLYLSVPTDDLKKWRESLLDAYYQVFTEEMKNYGLDANAIYPKEEFLQACIYYQIIGVIYALLFFPFSRISQETREEATSTAEKAHDFFYKDRSQQLIKWYTEFPLLKRFLNGATDELYQNFIKTSRGRTEFTQ